jgi:hypothetical protein
MTSLIQCQNYQLITCNRPLEDSYKALESYEQAIKTVANLATIEETAKLLGLYPGGLAWQPVLVKNKPVLVSAKYLEQDIEYLSGTFMNHLTEIFLEETPEGGVPQAPFFKTAVNPAVPHQLLAESIELAKAISIETTITGIKAPKWADLKEEEITSKLKQMFDPVVDVLVDFYKREQHLSEKKLKCFNLLDSFNQVYKTTLIDLQSLTAAKKIATGLLNINNPPSNYYLLDLAVGI